MSTDRRAQAGLGFGGVHRALDLLTQPLELHVARDDGLTARLPYGGTRGQVVSTFDRRSGRRAERGLLLASLCLFDGAKTRSLGLVAPLLLERGHARFDVGDGVVDGGMRRTEVAQQLEGARVLTRIGQLARFFCRGGGSVVMLLLLPSRLERCHGLVAQVNGLALLSVVGKGLIGRPNGGLERPRLQMLPRTIESCLDGPRALGRALALAPRVAHLRAHRDRLWCVRPQFQRLLDQLLCVSEISARQLVSGFGDPLADLPVVERPVRLLEQLQSASLVRIDEDRRLALLDGVFEAPGGEVFGGRRDALRDLRRTPLRDRVEVAETTRVRTRRTR